MKFGKIILKGGKKPFHWLAERWDALVAPAETRAKKRVEVEEQVRKTLDSANQSRQQNVEWKIEQYQKLGLTNKEIRDRILTDIEQGQDPLSKFIELILKNVIHNIREKEDDEEAS